MEIEMLRVPVISTGHLSEETRRRLDAECNENPWVPLAAWEYGYFMFVDDPSGEREEVPADIQALADWWRKHEAAGRFDNSRWIRLDRDGETAGDLPTYD